MTDTKDNSQNPSPSRPVVNLPPQRPQFNSFKKPLFRGPNFNSSNAFRNQNRGSGGK